MIRLLLAALAIIFSSAAALAADTGITLSPPFQQITLDPNASSATAKSVIANHTNEEVKLQVSAVDFGTLDQTGGLFLIGQPNDFSRKYGLTTWIQLDTKDVTLKPGESKTITATILNEASMKAGGHYAAILFTAGAKSSGAQVNLKPVVTELLFVRKTGGDWQDISLADFDHPSGLWGLPSHINLKFENRGNVHVLPRGIVSIIGPNGKVVSKGVINDGSNLILPESQRVYDTPIKGKRLSALPGSYKLVVNYHYEGNETYTTQEYKFTVWNVPLLAAFTVILAAIIIGLYWAVRRLRNR